MLTPERLRKFTEDYVGVEKMPVDAREGLKRTIESFK